MDRWRLTGARYTMFLAAFIMALPLWAQGPTSDVLVDAEEALDFSYERQLPIRFNVWLAPPEVATGNSGPIEGVSQAQRGDPWGQVVGSVDCSASVHNPHKSRDSGTVKVKAEGTCEFTPAPHLGFNQYPSQDQLTFTMHIYLTGGIASGSARFPKNGYLVRWAQNAWGGTQVDTGRCRNGYYSASMFVLVTVSGGFYVTGDPVLARDYKTAYVSTCP